MSSGSRERLDGVEATAADCREERRALDQLVAGERVQPSLRGAGPGVVRTSDSLEERRDAARRPDLTHQLDRTDVDAELERRSGDERPQVAATQTRLDAMTAVLGEAAVVRGHHLVAQAFAELVREPFRQSARVHEHDGRVVLGDELGDAVEDVAHLLGRGDGLELAVGQHEPEVELTEVPGVDDGGQGAVAHEQARHRLDRTLRGRQTDALRRGVGERVEPFERDREVRAALVACDRVDLVDDHGVDGAQHRSPAGARDEEIERFGRGDDEGGRSTQHRGALRRWWCLRCAPRRGASARRVRARPRPR